MFYTYIVFSSDHSSYFLWVGLQYAQWAPAVKKRQIVVHAQSLILCALTINSITNITSHVMVSYFSRLKLDRFQSFLLLFFFAYREFTSRIDVERLDATKDYYSYVYDTTLVGVYSLELPNQKQCVERCRPGWSRWSRNLLYPPWVMAKNNRHRGNSKLPQAYRALYHIPGIRIVHSNTNSTRANADKSACH